MKLKQRDWTTALLRAAPHIIEGLRVFIRTLEPGRSEDPKPVAKKRKGPSLR